jgi:hypothetical protein
MEEIFDKISGYQLLKTDMELLSEIVGNTLWQMSDERIKNIL